MRCSKHGKNKEQVAEYIRALTYDRQIWQDSIAGTETAHPGQLPPYKSIYTEWEADRPEWMPDFVGLVRGQLDQAKAITNHLLGLQQFINGQSSWETYLKDEEPRSARRLAEHHGCGARRAGPRLTASPPRGKERRHRSLPRRGAYRL